MNITTISILQIIIPLFSSIFAILSFNRFAAWLITLITSIFCTYLSYYMLCNLDQEIYYSFGGWYGNIGIEYRFTKLNQTVIAITNSVLLLFILFGKSLIEETILSYVRDTRQHLFYGLLLLIHVGYIGILGTNDLFNMYVFIEISSLATYSLMAQGSSSKTLMGAFDYMILGTIGATLILISIGFLLALTGSLNISDISEILNLYEEKSNLLLISIIFFITGAILKLAFFPMHFWMVRTYSTVSTFLLTYFTGITGMVGVMILVKFVDSTVNCYIIDILFSKFLRPLSLVTIIVCGLFALRSKNLKELIIYSSASQIGYIILLLTVTMMESRELLWQLLFMDSLNKIALFTIVSYIEIKHQDLEIDTLSKVRKSTIFQILSGFAIIFSAGLPLTTMFIVKIQILEMIFTQNLLAIFAIIIISNIIALIYHFNIAKAILFNYDQSNNKMINIDNKSYGLVVIIFLQIISLFFLDNITSYITGGVGS